MTTLKNLKPEIVYSCVQESKSIKSSQLYVFTNRGALICFGKNRSQYNTDEVIDIILKENPIFKSSNEYCYWHGEIILMKPIDARITDQVFTSTREALDDRLAELGDEDQRRAMNKAFDSSEK